jgi:hypothetical protein
MGFFRREKKKSDPTELVERKTSLDVKIGPVSVGSEKTYRVPDGQAAAEDKREAPTTTGFEKKVWLVQGDPKWYPIVLTGGARLKGALEAQDASFETLARGHGVDSYEVDFPVEGMPKCYLRLETLSAIGLQATLINCSLKLE